MCTTRHYYWSFPNIWSNNNLSHHWICLICSPKGVIAYPSYLAKENDECIHILASEESNFKFLTEKLYLMCVAFFLKIYNIEQILNMEDFYQQIYTDVWCYPWLS